MIRDHTPILEIADAPTTSLTTKDGSYRFDRIVIAAGAWVTRLIPQLKPYLRVTRQQMAFFIPPDHAHFTQGTFPLWTVLAERGDWYGFPFLQEGCLKIADDRKGQEVDPDIERQPTAEFLASVRAFVADRIPTLASAELVGGHSCLYTNTPDNHFLIDWVPDAQYLLIAGCGCGHGFKFGGSIGPVIADALEEKHNPLGDLFRMNDRFA